MVTRIRKLLAQKQLTPTQFADLIGVGRPVISHLLSERNKPSLEVVQRIIGAFPEISLAWLLSGTGEMLAPTDARVPGVPAAAPAATSPASETAPASSFTDTSAATVAAAGPRVPSQAASPAPPQPLPGLPSPAEATAPVIDPVTVAPVAAAPATSFRAARFVPSGAGTPAPAGAGPSPVASVLPPSQASDSVGPAPGLAAPAAPPPASALAATPITSRLAEPGKVIRRIVIFYRDGSFTDYQPEQ